MLVMYDQRQGLEFKVLYSFNKHWAILNPLLCFSVKTRSSDFKGFSSEGKILIFFNELQKHAK